MVKIKENPQHILNDGNIDLEAWLLHLDEKQLYDDSSLIRNACILSQLAGQDLATESGESCLQQGLAIAEILADLDVDPETIAAAIVYDSYLYADLSLDDISEQLNPSVAKLVGGVERMDAINIMRNTHTPHSRSQLENVRKMLLAIVDDVRIVLIKIAERLHVLRTISHLTDSIRRHIGQEVMQLYAPLANRLGIGQLKWEMEDLAFRYLQPEQYKEIAKGLNTRRIDRDKFVDDIVMQLEGELNELKIRQYDVCGRSKHIHSIHRKMTRKNVDLSEIYDATAVRILVPTVDDCYQVLSLVHDRWLNVPEEFDDYIANPKPNGYSSLHTAVIGPGKRTFEVQIRTHTMHEEAELGIAAHWRYKEGTAVQKESHERKIEWLREVLAWQKECAEQEGDNDKLDQQFIDDRIYIFTPNGDVIDLAKGSTPLDFAYHIHSEVGHRCRGAKIDGSIVPLTYTLKTGQQVEVLTSKQAKPSRDWLNPHLAYLHTSRAKAKVLHWFKQQDFDRNLEDGKTIMERETRKLSLEPIDYLHIVKQLRYKTSDDMLAALGRGDLRLSQIINRLPQPEKAVAPPTTSIKTPQKPSGADIYIEGVGNLLTHMAKCCQPIPSEPIIGYITIGRGISVHRQDCHNILNASDIRQQRLLQVDWGQRLSHTYPLDIFITAYDRKGLLHDITSLLAHEKTNLLAVNSKSDRANNQASFNVRLELDDLNTLSRILDRIKQLPNVIDAARVHQ